MDWHDPQDHSLDELLAAAQWPAPSVEQAARLEQDWRRLRRRQQFVARSIVALAVALPCVLIAVWAAWRYDRDEVAERPVVESRPGAEVDDARPNAATPSEREPVDAPQSHSASVPESHVAIDAPDRLQAREANTYERSLLLVHRARQRSRQAPPELAVAPLDAIEAAVSALVTEPESDSGDAARNLQRARPDAEERLAWLARRESGERRSAAVRLLAGLATRRSLGVLVACSASRECPPEVLAAIQRLATPEELVALARREIRSERQQLWIAALLRRDARQSAPAYLALVEEPSTSDAALAAMTAIETPPVEALFAALSSPRVATRWAAARALGSLNDPAVSARLARLTERSDLRTAALVGLLNSRDRVAVDFLAYARSDERLWPFVHSAESQMARRERVN